MDEAAVRAVVVAAAAENLTDQQRDKLQQAMVDSGMTERLP